MIFIDKVIGGFVKVGIISSIFFIFHKMGYFTNTSSGGQFHRLFNAQAHIWRFDAKAAYSPQCHLVNTLASCENDKILKKPFEKRRHLGKCEYFTCFLAPYAESVATEDFIILEASDAIN